MQEDNVELEHIMKSHLQRGGGPLDEFDSRRVFSRLGIPVVPGGRADTAAEAEGLARRLGFPVVLKILGSGISHKTDVGGVRLNICCRQGVRSAYSDMMSAVNRQLPDADIRGVSVQKQVVGGVELIVGGLRDPQFGPVVTFGLGGIMTESLQEIAFRLAPIDRSDAGDMLRETAAWSLIRGYRGREPLDPSPICDVLVRLGDAVSRYRWLEEVEANPFILQPGAKAVAVDALVVVRRTAAE